MKKTALDDDAYLYQKREEKTEKEKWSEMNRHQRMQYFLDYYLVKLLVPKRLRAIKNDEPRSRPKTMMPK